MTAELLLSILAGITAGDNADRNDAESAVVDLWLRDGQPDWTQAEIVARFRMANRREYFRRLLTDQDERFFFARRRR